MSFCIAKLAQLKDGRRRTVQLTACEIKDGAVVDLVEGPRDSSASTNGAGGTSAAAATKSTLIPRVHYYRNAH